MPFIARHGGLPTRVTVWREKRLNNAGKFMAITRVLNARSRQEPAHAGPAASGGTVVLMQFSDKARLIRQLHHCGLIPRTLLR
jgi:hypothetical protein